jgi:hypothetical protein
LRLERKQCSFVAGAVAKPQNHLLFLIFCGLPNISRQKNGKQTVGKSIAYPKRHRTFAVSKINQSQTNDICQSATYIFQK